MNDLVDTLLRGVGGPWRGDREVDYEEDVGENVRIIDADALMEVLHGEEGAEALDHFPLRLIKVKRIVDNMPTVPAIPLDWLRNMMLEREAEESRAAWVVMREWKKGQEART